MGATKLGFALGAWLLPFTGAAAQEAQQAASQQVSPAAEENDPIVVVGKKLPPEVVHRYVRQVSSTTDGQMTRFQDPICPRVIGFVEAYNQVVQRRIRRIARDAGAPVATENCRTNLSVIIAENADSLVDQIRRSRPSAFYGVNEMDLRRAFRPGPVHMWNSVVLLNEDNQRQTGMILTVKTASILYLPTKQVITGSTIVLDHSALLGKTLTQIGDYVAMRALSGAKPPERGIEADTVMTLFDPSIASPLSITEVDRSYLKALYKANPTARSNVAMSRISRQIAKDAEKRGIDTASD